MAEDWAADVKRYDAGADDDVIAGIVRYCGIALRKRDSSLVSFGDAKETARVRENFLKKKLALAHPDSELDAAILAIGERMKGDTTKNRVTVYYLLTDRFGAHQLFRKKAAGKAAPATAAAPPVAEAPAAKRAKAPAAAKPARPAAASTQPAAPARPITAAPQPVATAPVAQPAPPSAPVSLASSAHAAASETGQKLGFGHYRAGQHGTAGTGWLGGAVVVAAALLALGLLGGR